MTDLVVTLAGGVGFFIAGLGIAYTIDKVRTHV